MTADRLAYLAAALEWAASMGFRAQDNVIYVAARRRQVDGFEAVEAYRIFGRLPSKRAVLKEKRDLYSAWRN